LIFKSLTEFLIFRIILNELLIFKLISNFIKWMVSFQRPYIKKINIRFIRSNGQILAIIGKPDWIYRFLIYLNLFFYFAGFRIKNIYFRIVGTNGESLSVWRKLNCMKFTKIFTKVYFNLTCFQIPNFNSVKSCRNKF
jgi:hypothetical protein